MRNLHAREKLAPRASGFEFLHQDVANPSFNPGPDKPPVLRMPPDDGAFSLVIALSVFTHTSSKKSIYKERKLLWQVVKCILQCGEVLTRATHLPEISAELFDEKQIVEVFDPEEPKRQRR